MFSRVGTVRPVDEDGEDDPAIIPIQDGIPLITETGLVLTDENGNPIYI